MTNAHRERLISSDSHVDFTDDWIKERLPTRLHAVWDKAGTDLAAIVKKRMKGVQLHIEDFVDMEAAADPGHFDPHAKLAAMDRDGIEAEVIFPEVGGAKLCTPELMGNDWIACLQGYNDAMSDFASVDRNRLLTAYQIMPFDIEQSIKEVLRVAERGGRCVQIPPFPAEYGLPDFFHRSYDKLWATLQETGITIMNHLDTRQQLDDLMARDPTPQKGIQIGMNPMQLAETIQMWIMTGTMERFPTLKVLFIEPGLGWLPWFFDTVLDGRMHMHYDWPDVKLLPSEYFKRQMGATFMYEPRGLRQAYDYFGADCLYWSTDFPHPATCWPNSQTVVPEQFAKAGIPDADRQKIVRDNALKIFGLPV
jgi:predicted TIM-barrel fold metal-dependent hydrolase